VFKEHDETDNKYAFRSLIAGAGITLTENSDDIEIKGGGWWGDVTVTYTPVAGSTEYITLRLEAGSLKQVFTYAAGEVSGTEGTPGNATLAITDTDT